MRRFSLPAQKKCVTRSLNELKREQDSLLEHSHEIAGAVLGLWVQQDFEDSVFALIEETVGLGSFRETHAVREHVAEI